MQTPDPDRRPRPAAHATDQGANFRAVALLSLLGFALVAIAGVLLRPLTPIDETRYLAVAWEMWLSGDWLVPSKNFAIYPDKPPLLFWLINLVWGVTGVSETAGRLVAPATALLALGLTGTLARQIWPEDRGVGSRAVIALSGMLFWAVYGGMTMFDAMLTAAVLAGMLALLRAVRTGAWRWWAALGAAIGIGVLSKGPVVLLHLAPAMLLMPFWARTSDAAAGAGLRRGLAGTGLALGVGLAVAGLWLGPAILLGGSEYRDAILWTQSAGRIKDSFAHVQPWWFLPWHLPVLLFPWIFVPALWRGLRAADSRDAGLRLCAVWAGAALVLFSLISGKQTHYLLPELPAAALVVARISRDMPRFGLLWAVVPVWLLGLVGAAAGVGLIALGDAAELIDPRGSLLGWGMATLGLGWVALRLRGLAGGVVLSLGAMLSFNLLVASTAARSSFDTHVLAEVLAPHQADGIAFIGRTYHAEFNFAGRFRQPVATPKGEDGLAAWRRAHPRGVIVAQVGSAGLDWAPRYRVSYRDDPYAVWFAAEAPLR